MMMALTLVGLAGLSAQPNVAPAQAGVRRERPQIEAVVIHPFVAAMFTCGDHSAQESLGIGDALGTDCSVNESIAAPGMPRGFLRPYRTNGARNEDWFGWRRPVLAPFDGRVIRVHINPVNNRPGILGKPRASSIVFERADGVRVLYAHIMEPGVNVGDQVKAGQPVARLGNNGPSWSPHVHIGAWKGEMPMQIRFDQVAMGER